MDGASLKPASFGKRVAATLLDGIFLSIVAVLVAKAFRLSGAYYDGFEQGFKILYILLVPLVWYGYTVGKKICSIRIVKTNGSNMTFLTSLRRTIGSVSYLLPLMTGLVLSFGTNMQEYQEQMLALVTQGGDIPFPFIIGTMVTAGIFIASVLMVTYREDRRSIHDFIAGTCVTNGVPLKKQP